MARIPRDPLPDSSLALLRDGYRFIPDRTRRFGSDLFETRLMLRRAVCMSGPEAAEAFYVPGRFTRRGALPPTALRLLQDKGSVATLDGALHARRKAMFMSLLNMAGSSRMAVRLEEAWVAALPGWQARERIVLHEEARTLLCRTACEWVGLRLEDEELERLTRELGAMIEGAGSVGPRAARGLLLRTRTERWARGVIRDVRSGARDLASDAPLRALAFYEEDGQLLSPEVGAVELINILRPTVAVARFVVFAALALHEHPGSSMFLEGADEAHLSAFTQEVRRFYPFFPAVGGRVLEPFEWRGHRFAEGDWVLLDLYGTNRDARAWDDPHSFRPERFLGREVTPWELIPQGGGDHLRGHRCAGEWATVELMKTAARMLSAGMRYSVPEQDLSLDLGRMPALPASGLILTDVRPA